MPRNRFNPGQVSGDRHPAAKLRASDVLYLRHCWARTPGIVPRRALIAAWRRRFRVTQPTLWNAIHRRTWRDI